MKNTIVRRALVSIILLMFMFKFHSSLAFENDLTSICKRPNSSKLYIGGEFQKIFVVDE